MCSPSQLNQLLSLICVHARERFGHALESVILYGSYARGEATAESDVDIMILVDCPASQLSAERKHWSHFGTDLDLQFCVLTSFKLQDLSTFHQWRDTLPFFRNVMQEGVHLSA